MFIVLRYKYTSELVTDVYLYILFNTYIFQQNSYTDNMKSDVRKDNRNPIILLSVIHS